MKRYNYIDVAKGIGILFVVLGHVSGNNQLKTIIYSFHMPLFFILTGILIKYSESKYKDSSIKELLSKKFKTLIVPYFVLSLFFITANIVFAIIKNKLSGTFILNEVLAVISFKGRGALWFLPCLFIAEMIFITTIKKFNNVAKSVMLIFIPVLSLFLETESDILMVLIRGFVSVGFINVGFCFSDYIKYFNNKTKINVIIIPMIISVIGLSQINSLVDLYSLQYNNIILYIFNSVIGSLSVILICNLIFKNKVLEFFGKESLIIMGTHQIFLLYLTRIYKFMIKSDMSDGFNIIIGFIIIVLIEVIFVKLYRLISLRLKSKSNNSQQITL